MSGVVSVVVLAANSLLDAITHRSSSNLGAVVELPPVLLLAQGDDLARMHVIAPVPERSRVREQRVGIDL